jgi:hypothetical protein
MIDVFRIIECNGGEGTDRKGFCLGIDIRIGEEKIPCPVTRVCRSMKELEGEVQEVRDHLDRIMDEGRRHYGELRPAQDMSFSPEMSPEEIWSALSKIGDEAQFAQGFNGLEESRRKEVAEYVLTNCNVFSGKGALFSARYDSDTGFLE